MVDRNITRYSCTKLINTSKSFAKYIKNSLKNDENWYPIKNNFIVNGSVFK